MGNLVSVPLRGNRFLNVITVIGTAIFAVVSVPFRGNRFLNTENTAPEQEGKSFCPLAG